MIDLPTAPTHDDQLREIATRIGDASRFLRNRDGSPAALKLAIALEADHAYLAELLAPS